MKPEDLAALNEEIAGMARAGLPLDQGLAALAREMGRGPLKRVTSELANDLRAGRTLPEALDRQAGRVPPFYSGLVAAGMRTGRLSEILATLTFYARSIADLRVLVTDALFYPGVIFLFGCCLVALFCYVMPQYEDIFRAFNLQVPAVTTLVLTIGHYPLELVGVPLSVVVVGVLVLRFTLRRTERGRAAWARLVYAVPVIGTTVRAARLAAFTELLGILIDNEVPLPEAFRLAGQASSDPVMAAASRQIQEQLSQGVPLGEVLRGRGLVPEWLSWMTGMAQKRGTLGESLHQIAALYRRQIEMRAALLRSVLPPFLIVAVVGGFVAVFVFALLMPMLKLLEGLSK
jgi:type II secretory pathway component PulF